MSGDASGDLGFVGVPGVPEGWELVRIGRRQVGDWFLDGEGVPFKASSDGGTSNHVIVRKAETVCVWPRGVFKDGWIVQNSDGELSWHSHKPLSCYAGNGSRLWIMTNGISGDLSCTNDDGEVVSGQMFLTPLVFREDLPFDRRIQKVGPAVEKVGGEVANG